MEHLIHLTNGDNWTCLEIDGSRISKKGWKNKSVKYNHNRENEEKSKSS